MKIIGNQVLDKADSVLEQSLNLRLQKHNVTLSNVVNAQTPGYRALGFEFENQLQAAIGESDKLPMKVNHKSHIQTPGLSLDGRLRPDLHVKPTESVGNDGNTVDVDQEMADMAENQILYRATLELMNRRLSLLRYGINGGR